ncbi:S8 family peptidase [Clostridiaceae bacterium M8S5]|nr:S8 family peptidase [Clostridiaceae bacterium M8S5]
MRANRQMKLDSVVSKKIKSKTKDELPVIIRFKDNDLNSVSNMILNMSGKIKHNLPIVNSIACSMSSKTIEKLSKNPNIEYIYYDAKVFALMDIANYSIHSKYAHDLGYTGEGITVAVVDTGVSPHADLIKPKNRIVGFKDFVNKRTKPYDDNGHGTHVAGIIAGNGYSSKGRYSGIAPKANILAIKALDENGSGTTSDILNSVQYIVDTKNVYNTKVLNLSLGTPTNNSYKKDPLSLAAAEAVRAGLTVVVAAGNSGPSKKTILSPANTPSVISVGAVDDNKTKEVGDDFIASFSSRGPTVDGYNKPDVVAPGVDISSLSNSNNSSYVSLSGTSMAAPVVAGACALIYQKEGHLSPQKIKSMLKYSCVSLNDNRDNQGAGLINLKKLFAKDSSSIPDVYAYPKRDDVYFVQAILIVIFLMIVLGGFWCFKRY